MIKEKYEKWLNHPYMDEDLKAELANMSEAQINDAFYTDAKFGTGGMRNLLGAGTNRLNVYTIRKATVGFGQYLLTKDTNASVAIAYDNRHKSYQFAQEAAMVLASMGIKVYVYTSLRTTPQLSFTVRFLKCTGGIMITASHNPKEYNGYKVYDQNGCQLIPQLADQVIANIEKIGDQFVERPQLNENQKALICNIDKEVDQEYLNQVLTIQINPQLDKKNIKFVYSPQHGTAYQSIKYLFDKVGYNTTFVEEQCSADADFTNTECPNPEDARAYKLGLQYCEKVDADMMLTTDPDGDRLGIAVKHHGQYVLMTGNQTGAVLLEYIFSNRQANNSLPANAVMFNTVVTSDLGEAIGRNYGVDIEKTLTGFKYIGDKVAKYEINHEKQYVFGYEESYGYLIADFVRDKDANQSCLMIAEAANYYKQKGLTFIDVLQQLYDKYGYYDESQTSITLPGQQGSQLLAAMLAKLRKEIPSQLASNKVVKFQDFGQQIEIENNVSRPLIGFDKSDVLKYFMEDGCWIAIRPSGTEPKCKFYYCIKGKDKDDVLNKRDSYYKAIEQLIK